MFGLCIVIGVRGVLFCNHLAGEERAGFFTTSDRRQSKTLILSTNVDQKSLETKLLIAICRPTGDKWQSKTMFISILTRVRRLLRAFSIAAYAVRFA